MKIFDLLMAMAVLSITLGGYAGRLQAASFHAGGVGLCNGCHSMHNSSDGVPVGRVPSRWLLQAADSSSICLNCHAGEGTPNSPSVFSPDGSALTPGGDFYWLTKTFSWASGATPAASHGHNIVAKDYGLIADPSLAQAPGGTYQSVDLGCTSCHDPHGRGGVGTQGGDLPKAGSGSYGDTPPSGASLGNYRLLGGVNYNGGSQELGFTFLNAAPVAAQNPMIRFAESDASHVDYGVGMSEWCANCHVAFLNNQGMGGMGDHHPAGKQMSFSKINTYNTYLRTGDLSGSADTAYLQFVPFERGQGNASLLDPTSTKGPGSGARVMCLTCHRAHGSAFRVNGRWDLDAVLLASSHPAATDAGVSGNDVLYSYYGRNIEAEFGLTQKQFCEKCHGGGGP
jgi:cytochrome c553